MLSLLEKGFPDDGLPQITILGAMASVKVPVGYEVIGQGVTNASYYQQVDLKTYKGPLTASGTGEYNSVMLFSNGGDFFQLLGTTTVTTVELHFRYSPVGSSGPLYSAKSLRIFTDYSTDGKSIKWGILSEDSTDNDQNDTIFALEVSAPGS